MVWLHDWHWEVRVSPNEKSQFVQTVVEEQSVQLLIKPPQEAHVFPVPVETIIYPALQLSQIFKAEHVRQAEWIEEHG